MFVRNNGAAPRDHKRVGAENNFSHFKRHAFDFPTNMSFDASTKTCERYSINYNLSDVIYIARLHTFSDNNNVCDEVEIVVICIIKNKFKSRTK